MAEERGSTAGHWALRVGLLGAIGVGAVVSGLVMSRRGRHLLREAWQLRRRSRLEDRVLDAFWGDPVLSKRELEVDERPEGTVTLSGVVYNDQEHHSALALAQGVNGVDGIVDELTVQQPRTRASPLRARRQGGTRR